MMCRRQVPCLCWRRGARRPRWQQLPPPPSASFARRCLPGLTSCAARAAPWPGLPWRRQTPRAGRSTCRLHSTAGRRPKAGAANSDAATAAEAPGRFLLLAPDSPMMVTPQNCAPLPPVPLPACNQRELTWLLFEVWAWGRKLRRLLRLFRAPSGRLQSLMEDGEGYRGGCNACDGSPHVCPAQRPRASGRLPHGSGRSSVALSPVQGNTGRSSGAAADHTKPGTATSWAWAALPKPHLIEEATLARTLPVSCCWVQARALAVWRAAQGRDQGWVSIGLGVQNGQHTQQEAGPCRLAPPGMHAFPHINPKPFAYLLPALRCCMCMSQHLQCQ